jgi:U8 snoRNA-decapping enzyme
MQLRFDGCIGFPGGFVDADDLSIEDGLNRELKEEMNLSDEHFIRSSDHLFSHLLNSANLILHFYAKYVSMEQLKEIEKNCLSSRDWGYEVAGIIRPPLYELDKDRGFRQFLKNKFAGNAAYQLIRSLFYLDIMKKHEILDILR